MIPCTLSIVCSEMKTEIYIVLLYSSCAGLFLHLIQNTLLKRFLKKYFFGLLTSDGYQDGVSQLAEKDMFFIDHQTLPLPNIASVQPIVIVLG